MTVQPNDAAATFTPRWLATVTSNDSIKVTLYETSQLTNLHKRYRDESAAFADQWRDAIREALANHPAQQQLPLFQAFSTRLVMENEPPAEFVEAFRAYAYSLAYTYSLR